MRKNLNPALQHEEELQKTVAVETACSCCLELLDQLKIYRIDLPNCEIKELNIHLGVGAGSYFNVFLGEEGGKRWEHLGAGPSIDQLKNVLAEAKAG